jgi:hypothetical protein
MQRLDWVGGAAMARRRAWSGRRKAAVTWRPIIVGEKVVCTAVIVATASERHSADDESGCERVQGCKGARVPVSLRSWSCLVKTRMAGEFELQGARA